MRIDVDYGDKKFGNGGNSRKYKLTVSEDPQSKELTIEFKFDYHARTGGKSDNSFSMVYGGEICLPKREATVLATAILWHCLQSECQSKPLPVELVMDEREPLNTNLQFITDYAMAKRVVDDDRKKRLERLGNEIVEKSDGRYAKCSVQSHAQYSTDLILHFYQPMGEEVKVTLVCGANQTDQAIKDEIERQLPHSGTAA